MSYTGTDIVEIDVTEIRDIPTSGMQKTLVLTTGGAGGVTGNATSKLIPDLFENDFELILDNSNQITDIQSFFGIPDSVSLISNSIESLESIKIDIASAAWSSGVLTLNFADAHNLTDNIYVNVSGVLPDAINGKYKINVTDSDTFTIPVAIDPDDNLDVTNAYISCVHAKVLQGLSGTQQVLSATYASGKLTLAFAKAHGFKPLDFIKLAGFVGTADINGDHRITGTQPTDATKISILIASDPIITSKGFVAKYSITKTITSAAWATGTLTLTSAGHGLKANDYIRGLGFDAVSPNLINTNRVITSVTANTILITMSDPGAVTTFGKIAVLNALPTGIPIGSAYISISKALDGVHETVYSNASDAYFAYPPVAGVIKVSGSSRISIAKSTVANNPLIDGIPFQLLASGFGNTAFNGTKLATRRGDDFYYPVNTIAGSAKGKIGYAIATATEDLAESIGVRNAYTLKGNKPDDYNGIKQSTVVTTKKFVFPIAKSFSKKLKTDGYVLDYDTSILARIGASYFKQGLGYPLSILDVGSVSVADGISALSDYLTNNPKAYHAIVLPYSWDIGLMSNLTALYSDSLNSMPVFFIPLASPDNQEDFEGQTQVILFLESNQAEDNEYIASASAAWYAGRTVSESNKLPQFTYQGLIGISPYAFGSVNGDFKKDLDSRRIAYAADKTESGSADVILYNGFCQYVTSKGSPIDLNSIWAKNYINTDLDKRLAKFLFDNASNPGMRYSLVGVSGNFAIKAAAGVAQGGFNDYAKFGVCQPTIVKYIDFFQWSQTYPQLADSKHLAKNMSVEATIAIGFLKITFDLGVQF